MVPLVGQSYQDLVPPDIEPRPLLRPSQAVSSLNLLNVDAPNKDFEMFPKNIEGIHHLGLMIMTKERVRQIRSSWKALIIDPSVGRDPLRPIYGILEELRDLYRSCPNRGLLQREVKPLFLQVREGLRWAAPQCMHRMSFLQLQELFSWGMSQEVKDECLRLAVRYNAPLPAIQYLVQQGADIHQRLEHDRNMLMYATMYADPATVEYFLTLGFNPREMDDQGNTARKLQQLNRGIELPALQTNTFFPFDDRERLYFAAIGVIGYLVCVEDFAMSFGFEVGKALGDPASGELEAFQLIFSTLYAAILAPANTLECEAKEYWTREDRALLSYIQGFASFSLLAKVFAIENSSLITLSYVAFFGLCYWLLDTPTLQAVAIDYVAPIAKVVNVVSMVAMLILGNTVYAAVTLSLYTISLLDRCAVLPTCIQTVYYCGLRLIFVGMANFVLLCMRCCDYVCDF